MNKDVFVSQLLQPQEAIQKIHTITVSRGEMEVNIEVLERIPYEKIVAACQEIINVIIDDKGYISEPILELMTRAIALKYWTNINVSFLDELTISSSDLYSLCDSIEDDVWPAIIGIIKEQYLFFTKMVRATLQNIVSYKNSALGIIGSISTSVASDVEKNQQLIKELTESENYGLLKAIFGNDENKNESEEK